MDFKIQSAEQRKFLVEATKRYKLGLPGSQAEDYLVSRGLLTQETAKDLSRFQIGFVDDPMPGHEWYKNWLAIPYLRKGPTETGDYKGWSVATMKFRCIQDHDCSVVHPKSGKYMGHPGANAHLYNTVDIQNSDDEIAICEGELDAVTAHLCGIPAVGVPGVKNWKDHYYRLFKGYKKIWIFADGDTWGEGLAKKLSERMGDKLHIVKMPDGEDVNSVYNKYGKHALLKGVGRE